MGVATDASLYERDFYAWANVLLLHLLKWHYQRGLQGNSWRTAIKIQRRELADHLAGNPSLNAQMPHCIRRAYGNAANWAARSPILQRSYHPETKPALSVKCPNSQPAFKNPLP
jgi:hypothetical protein